MDGDGLINKSELKIAIEHLTGSELEPAEVTKKKFIYKGHNYLHRFCDKAFDCLQTSTCRGYKEIIIYKGHYYLHRFWCKCKSI